MASACQCFGLYDERNEIVGFCAVLHQPHSINKKIKRCSRLVILPDYQGIGLGVNLLNVVAKYYSDNGFDFVIVTSAKNLIGKLIKSKEWSLSKVGRSKWSTKSSAIDFARKSMRRGKTGRFKYKRGV